MPTIKKPRFHDEECFGVIQNGSAFYGETETLVSPKEDDRSSRELIESADRHFKSQNVKTAVDEIVLAYQALAQENERLKSLRNQAFRNLSTLRGWQGPPHPEALRLRRLTPSIALRSTRKESST